MRLSGEGDLSGALKARTDDVVWYSDIEPHPTRVRRVQYAEMAVRMPTQLVRAALSECVRHLPDQYEVIRIGSLSLETQLLWRDFRNLSTCTIFCGGLSYGHRTT